jgi:hypothetical protein
MELLTVNVYNTEVEAQIFKLFLEENGIEAFLFNSNSVAMYPIFNSSIGGYKLQVEREDFLRAKFLSDQFIPVVSKKVCNCCCCCCC